MGGYCLILLSFQPFCSSSNLLVATSSTQVLYSAPSINISSPFLCTLTFTPNGLSAGAINVANDSFVIIDADDSNNPKKESIADFVSGIAGTNLTASSGVLNATSSLTLVTSGSVTGVTGITLDNVFTTSFTNYLFQFNGTGVSDSYVEQIRLQFRAGGSTNSDSDSSFVAMLPFKQGSSQTGVESDIDQSYFQLIGNWVDNEKFATQITILEPQVSGQSTSIMYQTGNRYNEGTESYATHNGTGIKEGTGSFDGLYFFVDGSQTITGNYRLYGYK